MEDLQQTTQVSPRGRGFDPADPLAIEIIKRQERLERHRLIWEMTWRDIALRLAPQEETYFHGSWSGSLGAGKTIDQARLFSGIRRDLYQYDSYPAQCWEKYAAVLHSISIPRGQRWHTLKVVDPKLAKDRNVQRYLEDFTDLLFSVRYSGNSNFDASAHAGYLSNGLYGHGWMFIEDRLSKGIGYSNCHMSQMYPIENPWGLIDKIHRKYRLTAEQAVRKWPIAQLPQIIKDAYANSLTQDKEFWFVHAVYPNIKMQTGRRDYIGMKFICHEVCVESKTIIDTGGYRSFPYAVTRHITLPQQTYSLSPAYICLADIKTLNEMMKTNLRFAQLTNDPPLMLRDMDSLQPFAMRPGMLNHGWLDEDGKPSAMPLELKGDPRFASELMEQKRNAIAANFYNTLFDILVQAPEMTATQALIRAQEKGALLAPVASRQETEFLNVTIRRETQILEDAGAMPKPPEALIASGGGLRIEYDSPLTKAQKSEQGAGILQTMQAAAQMAQFDPNVRFRMDWDKALQTLAVIYSCPASVIRSDEEYQAQLQQEEENVQQAQQAQMALPATQGIKNVAQAQAALGRNGGGPGQSMGGPQ